MEYINNDVSTFLENSAYTHEVLHSIVQQVVFALLDFHMNYGISHNDINRGNLLLQQEDAKDIVYTIGDLTYTMNTCGYTCIFIDFQRGTVLEKKDADIWLELAVDELTLALYLLSKWVMSEGEKATIQRMGDRIMRASTLNEVWEACRMGLN
jgi:predicted unusual protein kinase regulating ubiquinone biosynthesis (AarF/ABC1/UbiB family)